jgi:membrane associated rhomboid family serine protease
VLYGFGEAVESYFLQIFGETMGRVNYILLYLLSGIFADVPTFLKHKDNQMFSAVGASGAVSGILLAFVIFQPWAPLTFVFLPFIQIPAIIMTIGFLAYSSWAGKNDRGGRIDHSAHFYGAIFGFLFTIVLKPELFSMFIQDLANPRF